MTRGHTATGSEWPMRGRTTSLAPGIEAAVSLPAASGTRGSSAPWMTRVGAVTLGSVFFRLPEA